LLRSIDTGSLVGLRDRAIIGILMWTGVRAGSIAKLRFGDLYEAADQWLLRFDEKRRRCRDIPVRHDLQQLLRHYIIAANMTAAAKSCPMFLSIPGRANSMSDRAMTGHDIYRMVKRRLRRAGLPDNISPHSFRVAVATDLLEQQIPLADVQYLLGHADSRTTRLYDRREKLVTRNIVERIRLGA
jgi:site-specific recombinase XerD